MLQYTVINHQARREMGISHAEYIFADMIYHLSNNPSAPVSGWCTMSRPTMAKEMDFTPRGIIKLINRLCGMWIIEKNEQNYLRTGRIFYEYAVNKVYTPLNSVHVTPELSSPQPLNLVHPTPELSSPNIYIDNNTDKNINKSHTPAREKISESKPQPEKTEPLKSELKLTPPVPAAPPLAEKPDPVQIITAKILSRSDYRDRWQRLNGWDEGEMGKHARQAAHGWIKKQVGFDENTLLASVERTTAMIFVSFFESSWIPNISRYSPPRTDKPKAAPVSQYKYIR